MEGGDHGHGQPVNQLEHMAAVRPAEDAVLVLNRHYLGAAPVEPRGSPAVVANVVAIDPARDLERVQDRVSRLVHGNHLARSHGVDEVSRECRNSAPTRGIAGYVGDPRKHRDTSSGGGGGGNPGRGDSG